jgi:hypothetical protein
VAQSDHRIDAHRAPGGHEVGQWHYQHEKHAESRKRESVEGELTSKSMLASTRVSPIAAPNPITNPAAAKQPLIHSLYW